jgi:transporter family-2 protein
VTGLRQRRRASIPIPLALALMVTCGALAGVQSRINAELGQRIGSAVVAALLSFAVGLVVILGVVASRQSSRTGIRSLVQVRGPWWSFSGGAAGAFFVFVAATTVPTLGVAMLSVAQVFGQITGALVVDRLGISPSGRQPVSWPRVAGAALGVVAVVIAALGRPGGRFAPGLLVLVVIAGFGLSVQVAVNGLISARTGDPLTATALNFVVGTVVLVIATAVVVAAETAHGVTLRPLPEQWWLYLGGPLGIVFVTITVMCVPVLGVLRVGLGTVAGQLIGAIVLDTVVPGGPGTSIPVIVGAVLTVAAVAVAGLRPRPRRA